METFYRNTQLSGGTYKCSCSPGLDGRNRLERQTDRHQGTRGVGKNDFPPAICKRKVRNGSLMSVHQHE
mgnify:CR=1 FL=1